MGDTTLIVFFAAVIFCVILTFFYFLHMFRHALLMKRGSDFVRQMQMHPLQLERFSTSEGDVEETETTSLCLPIPQQQGTPSPRSPLPCTLLTVTYPQDPHHGRSPSQSSRGSFFQLPHDSYFKYSLVDDSLSGASSRNSSGKRSRNGALRPESLWSGDGSRDYPRKNTWENVMQTMDVKTPDHFYISKDELNELVGRLPTICENKEFLI